MTKIKLCGLSRMEDVRVVNELKPEYVGFVFAPSSRRFVSPERATVLREAMDPGITTVGVFVNEKREAIAELLHQGIIDMVQLHGTEDAEYIRRLRECTDKPLIQAYPITGSQDVRRAEGSLADVVLLDSSGGSGKAFDWRWIAEAASRQEKPFPYFLAGGLTPENVGQAIAMLHPFAVDVSSGIESQGVKDRRKMEAFVTAVRKEMKK